MEILFHGEGRMTSFFTEHKTYPEKDKIPSPKALKELLQLGDITFLPGELVDCIKVTDDFYKVFVRNGWWKVHSSYFE